MDQLRVFFSLRTMSCEWGVCAPVPGADHEVADVPDADGASQDVSQLRVGVAVGGGQRRHVDGVADGLVTGRVDHVAQGLLGVLDAAAFGVPVPQEDQLLLLPRPQASHALFINLGGRRCGKCGLSLKTLWK